MGKTSIEWTDCTWNPTRGCSRISPGCVNCYAERQAARFSDEGQYAHGFVKRTPSGPRWTGKLALVEDKLREPLSWRKPRRVFVNSMSDLFHESLSNTDINRVFSVMARAERHTFQVLTKRAGRMRAWFEWARVANATVKTWPLPNVWLGVSVEDQERANERIPHLLNTPAATHFLSVEPLLEHVDLVYAANQECEHESGYREPDTNALVCSKCDAETDIGVDWVIVGGESGPNARSCSIDWIRSIVKQCKAADVACFVKQIGAIPTQHCSQCGGTVGRVRGGFVDACGPTHATLVAEAQRIHDRKGGDPNEWPSDLRVREFPTGVDGT